jgi:hypothetical protein
VGIEKGRGEELLGLEGSGALGEIEIPERMGWVEFGNR